MTTKRKLILKEHFHLGQQFYEVIGLENSVAHSIGDYLSVNRVDGIIRGRQWNVKITGGKHDIDAAELKETHDEVAAVAKRLASREREVPNDN